LIRLKNGASVDLEEAIRIRNLAFAIFPDRKFLTLIDASNVFGNASPEALRYFAKEKELINRRMAQAIIVNNLPIKILAKFYLRVVKPVREAKIFGNIEDATVWLAEKKHLLED